MKRKLHAFRWCFLLSRSLARSLRTLRVGRPRKKKIVVFFVADAGGQGSQRGSVLGHAAEGGQGGGGRRQAVRRGWELSSTFLQVGRRQERRGSHGGILCFVGMRGCRFPFRCLALGPTEMTSSGWAERLSGAHRNRCPRISSPRGAAWCNTEKSLETGVQGRKQASTR